MTEGIAERVLEHLSVRADEMVELLARLVEAESPTLDPVAQAVPQRILTERLEALEFAVTHYRGDSSGGMLLAKPMRRLFR